MLKHQTFELSPKWCHEMKDRTLRDERNRGPLGEPAPTVGIMKNFGDYKF